MVATNLGDIPVMADFSHRDVCRGAPTAKERNIGWFRDISEVLHESIQRRCPIALHNQNDQDIVPLIR